jgi:dTDP-glucose 4,6-dehydratase
MPHPLERDLDHVLAHTTEVWESLRGQRIFITGGTGFVGTWLVESFLWANERLNLKSRAILLTRNPEAFRRKAPQAANHSSIEFLRGEANSFEFPSGEYSFVVHAATQNYFEATPERPASTFDPDTEGTRRVLEFARTHGTRRLLFASSGAVYGKQPAEVTHLPEDYPGAPATTDTASAYGQAKRVSEWLCSMYAQQFGFSAAIARLFAFVGPHLAIDANFAVGNFIRDVLRGGPVRIGGDGTPYRSYLYAADLAIWLWTILIRGESGKVYNVGSPEALTIAELARAVVSATVPQTKIEIAKQPVPGAPASRYVPSTERVQRELGLRVLVPLDESVRRTYNWHRELAPGKT